MNLAPLYQFCTVKSVTVIVDSETRPQINCVFLEDLYASLGCQEWLDVQSLDQVTLANV